MTTYIPVRDDAGLKSLSTVERTFIQDCALQSLRADGRRWNQLRPRALQLTRSENNATATVLWGTSTRVTAVCTAELLPPLHDDHRASTEGIVSLSVDLSPSASTSFRHCHPAATSASNSNNNRASLVADPEQKLLTNRILRCLERTILVGGALDTEALCVVPGQWIWKLVVCVTVVDAAGGNLVDASTLACMAALRHYRKPQVELHVGGNNQSGSSAPPRLIPADTKEPTPLPLHHTPLSVSFALLPLDESSAAADMQQTRVFALVDPDAREGLVMSRGATSLTISLNVHGELCLLDFGGGCELTPFEIKECASLAKECVSNTLCPQLEQALAQADEQALQERLDRLTKHQFTAQDLPPLPEDTIDGVAFLQHCPESKVESDIDSDRVEAEKALHEADEALRRQALDYNLGHMPARVRDNKSLESSRQPNQNSALLNAMLLSVQGQSSQADTLVQLPSDAREDDGMDVDDEVPIKSMPESPITESNQTSALKSTTQATESNPTCALDSDEEESTMQLISEFDSSAPLTTTPVVPETLAIDDDDVDDLAAAIKNKKKKKGKN
jgi:exosome complex component RRP45